MLSFLANGGFTYLEKMKSRQLWLLLGGLLLGGLLLGRAFWVVAPDNAQSTLETLPDAKFAPASEGQLVVAPGNAQSTLETHPDAKFAPASEGQLLVNSSYLVDFDTQSRIAFWVHYALTAQECIGAVPRKKAFRSDSRVAQSPKAKDYKDSKFDRGHLKPAADSKSVSEMRDSFLMTNMAPQRPKLNQGIWKKLEKSIRTWGLLKLFPYALI